MTKTQTSKLVSIICSLAVAAALSADERPNIIVIVLDDLGYSDIGAFGSEIDTPNLDALAQAGLQLTNFHSGVSCAPTRAMLLSGTDNHLAGLGWQGSNVPEAASGKPGYEVYLNERVVALPTLLRDVGYHTYMAGKWHLGSEPEQRPNMRGFEKVFALHRGGASHYGDGHALFADQALYTEDGNVVDKLPDDFWSSAFYTDKMIEYIDQRRGDQRPFFAYLAYTAPHWPLAAPDDWIDKYKGRYDAGWDALREERLSRMKQLGIVEEDAVAYPRFDPRVSAWDDMSDVAKEVAVRKMEVYAAMVANLDHHIGRFVDYLKETGAYDNSFILVMSDNGAEGNNIGLIAESNIWVPARFDNRVENIGRYRSYTWLGPGWAQVAALPHRMYKAFVSQGGIRVPAIVNWSGLAKVGGRSDAMMTVMDVMPTALGLAGIEHPGSHYQGRPVHPLRGRAMLGHLRGDTDRVHPANYGIGWEGSGRRAFRQGDWKIRWLWEPYGPDRWELFNVADDPGETNDLAAQYPNQLEDLAAGWENYVAETGVVVLDRDYGYGR